MPWASSPLPRLGQPVFLVTYNCSMLPQGSAPALGERSPGQSEGSFVGQEATNPFKVISINKKLLNH